MGRLAQPDIRKRLIPSRPSAFCRGVSQINGRRNKMGFIFDHDDVKGKAARNIYAFLLSFTLFLPEKIRLFYSCLSATIGSTLAARIAGYNPKVMPMPALMNKGITMLSRVMTVGIFEK